MTMPTMLEVSNVISYCAGVLTGAGYMLVAYSLRRAPRREAAPAPEPFWSYEAEAKPTVRGLPAGLVVRASDYPAKPAPPPAPPYSVGKDETILNPLLSMLLNEYSGGERIPRTGVPLTWRLCSKWGMKRAGWQALCEYVYPGRGYLAPGPGGKLVTVLAAARAREFVRKARKLGRVATPLPEGAVYPEI